ncbi:MAG: DUF72 domain-containing protein [Vicinamibacterales bacterium]
MARSGPAPRKGVPHVSVRGEGVALDLFFDRAHDMHGSATGKIVIGRIVYVRFHFGTQKYGGGYDDRRLDEWASWLAGRVREGQSVFAYFNNDTGGHAPRDAVRLRVRLHALLNRDDGRAAPLADAGDRGTAPPVRRAVG